MRLEAGHFAGTWALTRQIEDRQGQQQGQFAGQAVFTPQGAGLIYAETGVIRFGAGPAMTAERRYLWRFEAGGVDVRFADGAAFHHFVPEGIGAGTDHPCGDDYYRVTYDFTRWPEWEAVWQVTGPRKDYTSHSWYRPA